MHNTKKISKDYYWVGASDRRLELFENVMPITKGVSYNSYLLIDEKTVLLDTADASVSRQFLENVKYVLNGRSLDYLIVNHMEPDHSANVMQFMKTFPKRTFDVGIAEEHAVTFAAGLAAMAFSGFSGMKFN